MAKRVKRAPNLPNVTEDIPGSFAQLNRSLYLDGVETAYRLNLAFPKDGTEPFEAPLPLQSVVTASLPTASLWEGALIYDTTVNVPKFSDGTSWKSLFFGTNMGRRTITGADTVAATDAGGIIEITSGTFTLAFTAASTLSQGFWTIIFNNGTGDVTLDPASTEQIDGLTTWILYPGGAILVSCTGSAFESILLSPMRKQFDSSGTLTKPGVGKYYRALLWGGGGSGGRAGAADGGGGGGGGAFKERNALISEWGTTETITIGTGGTAITTDNTNGNAGNNTTLGSLVTAFGGGGGNGSASQCGGGGGGGSFTAGVTSTSATGGNGGDPVSALVAPGGGSTVALTSIGGAAAISGSTGTYGGGGGGGGDVAAGGAGGGASTYGGGGGGGGAETGAAGTGGTSFWGGGGGGGGSGTAGTAAGGSSVMGGAGGAGNTGNSAATAGTVPGGGGGGSETANSGAGADGRMIILMW